MVTKLPFAEVRTCSDSRPYSLPSRLYYYYATAACDTAYRICNLREYQRSARVL